MTHTSQSFLCLLDSISFSDVSVDLWSIDEDRDGNERRTRRSSLLSSQADHV